MIVSDWARQFRRAQKQAPTRYQPVGALSCPGVNVDPEAKLTTDEAVQSSLRVTRDVIYAWKARGLITPVGKRGRQPLYRWLDLLLAEQRTRAQTSRSHRRLAA